MQKIWIILSWPFVGLIKVYQWGLSPLLGAHCRFTPSCSQYSIEAFKKYGLFKGCLLTVNRLIKCHPWGKHGYDPVK